MLWSINERLGVKGKEGGLDLPAPSDGWIDDLFSLEQRSQEAQKADVPEDTKPDTGGFDAMAAAFGE